MALIRSVDSNFTLLTVFVSSFTFRSSTVDNHLEKVLPNATYNSQLHHMSRKRYCARSSLLPFYKLLFKHPILFEKNSMKWKELDQHRQGYEETDSPSKSPGYVDGKGAGAKRSVAVMSKRMATVVVRKCFEEFGSRVPLY
jgi:hypothetical protein